MRERYGLWVAFIALGLVLFGLWLLEGPLSTAIRAVAIALFLVCFYLFARERAGRIRAGGEG